MTQDELLAKYRDDIVDVLKDGEFDNDGFYQDLYEFCLPDMPYGTAKARDGDPNQFMYDFLDRSFGYLVNEVLIDEY